MEPFATAAVAPTTDDQQDAPRPPHVVLLASPGAGHLIPLAELARRLADHHAVAATLVTFADLDNPDARSTVLSSLPASVATATLPAVFLDDLPADACLERVLFEVVHRSLPHLRVLLRSIGSTAAPLAALVPDFFCAAALSVASEIGVPGYIFYPTSLAALSLMRRTVELHDGAAAGEHRALPDPLELPGGVSLRNTELPCLFRESTVPLYGQLVETGRQYRRAAGFLANSFYELEPAAVEDSKKAAEKGTFPPAYPVGPLVRSSSDEPGESACLDWLDLQPAGSVVFVSFGSAGMLSVEQTRELAAGLELSGHRFFWVVRMPSLNGESFAFGSNGAHRNGGHDDDPLAWLPDGFLERTSGRGLAVAAWAPQVHVLSHPATAAFVSHCGWNSTQESVAAGVPMIAWPLHAEQRMNAVVLEESVGVAVRPRRGQNDVEGGGVVTRQEIAAAVKELMEGEKGRAVRRRGEGAATGGQSGVVAGGVVAAGAGGDRRQVEDSDGGAQVNERRCRGLSCQRALFT